jgi:Tfp pilus assembly protein PilV
MDNVLPLLGKLAEAPQDMIQLNSGKNRSLILISILAVSLLSLATILPATISAAASSNSQYAAYSVTGTNSTRTFSATVNQTIAPDSAKSGFSIITLALGFSSSNLTYSKVVNSSEALFPVIPSIGNQSFTYQYHNYSISATISEIGSGSVSFNGATYTTSNYDFSVSVTNSSGGGQPMTASGQLSTLPSGLLYSASISARSYKVTIMLVGTNLAPGSDPASSRMTTTTAAEVAAGGIGTVAVGVGAFAFFKRKGSAAKAGTTTEEQKPLHHVD